MQGLGHAAHLPSPNFLSGGAASRTGCSIHPFSTSLSDAYHWNSASFWISVGRAALTSSRTLKRFCLFFHSAGSR